MTEEMVSLKRGSIPSNPHPLFTVCVNRPDGLYEWEPCSTQFLTCSGKIARIMDCPAGLIYNVPIEACDYAHNVAACEGSGEASAADEPSTMTTTEEMPTTEMRTLSDCEGAAVGSELCSILFFSIQEFECLKKLLDYCSISQIKNSG